MASITPAELRKRMNARASELENERSTWLPHWRELSDYILPRRGRFLYDDKSNNGSKINQRIMNNSATLALRTMSNGMMSGITSPARPWFKLNTRNVIAKQSQTVKTWLYETTTLMQQIFAASNLYSILPTVYEELGLFGTSAMVAMQDYDTVVNFQTFTAGEYSLGLNYKNEVDSLYRKFRMQVGGMVEQFDYENCSKTVQDQFDKGKYDVFHWVRHVIEPNRERDITQLDDSNKKYRSVYYEIECKAGEEDQFLKFSGFDDDPKMCPRWFTNGSDIYGRSPAMDALQDTKGLQNLEKRKHQGIDKMVNPPLVGTPDLRNEPVSQLPGAIVFSSGLGGGQRPGLAPLYNLNIPINEFREEIQAVTQRLNSTFYADLFLMLSNDNSVQPITAAEVSERHEEKLLQLGPVLERLYSELLNPLIARTFAIMSRVGILPVPPAELHGQPIKVEFTSILAQAQQISGTVAIERLIGFVGSMGSTLSDALLKVDVFATIDEYADAIGVSPIIIKSSADAQKAKDAMQQAQQTQAASQQAQQVAQSALPAAQSAQILANTDSRNQDSLLNNLGLGATQ